MKIDVGIRQGLMASACHVGKSICCNTAWAQGEGRLCQQYVQLAAAPRRLESAAELCRRLQTQLE
jgi:hypothetical protein